MNPTRPGWAEGLPIAAKVRELASVSVRSPNPKAMLDDAPPIAPEHPVHEGAEETPFDVEEDAGDDLVEAEEDGPDLLAVHGEKEHDGEETRGGNSYASGEWPWGSNVAEYIIGTQTALLICVSSARRPSNPTISLGERPLGER